MTTGVGLARAKQGRNEFRTKNLRVEPVGNEIFSKRVSIKIFSSRNMKMCIEKITYTIVVTRRV